MNWKKISKLNDIRYLFFLYPVIFGKINIPATHVD